LCTRLVAPALHGQTFDATNLHEPVEIGTLGLVQVGDDPAWSRVDFDDSKWLPVDAKTQLREDFPGKHADIVWRRIHDKVSPQETYLALQAYSLSRAYEVYVNGEKLIASGQVKPYVPYSRSARLIVHIPPEQVRAGSITIAIRARAPRSWWTSVSPGFVGSRLTLGNEATLRDRNALWVIGDEFPWFLENLLSLSVGLVALALFLGQRQRMEYFWIFVLGLLNVASLPLIYLLGVRDIPTS
jgi:hypothetical protein